MKRTKTHTSLPATIEKDGTMYLRKITWTAAVRSALPVEVNIPEISKFSLTLSKETKFYDRPYLQREITVHISCSGGKHHQARLSRMHAPDATPQKYLVIHWRHSKDYADRIA